MHEFNRPEFLRYNANHNGLAEMAAFLSVFSKKMTVCPIPIAGFGYVH
jgi:hypothetical protein